MNVMPAPLAGIDSLAEAEDSAKELGRTGLASWGVGGFALVAIAGLLVGARRAEAPYADSDVLWGARAGRDFLSSGTIARSDPYSWTVHGRGWTPNSWGWNLVLGIAHRLAGLTGIALLGIAMMVAIGLAVAAAARRAGAKPVWTAILLQVVAGVFALFMYPRAQIADYAMIFVLPLLLSATLGGDRSRFVRGTLAIAATQAIWMNLHSAAVLGPVLLLAAGSGIVVSAERRAQMMLRVGGLVVMSAVCCLATPYGTAPITHLNDVRTASADLISEWHPVGFASAEQLLGVGALVLGAAACWFAFRAKRYDNIAVLVVLGVATASAIRFTPMLALYTIPEFAAAAGRLRVRELFLNRVCALALAILAVACLTGVRGFAEPGSQNASASLVAELPRGCRLLNDFGIGGDVILARPDVPVSIDSRNDLYGRTLELRSLSQLGNPKAGLAYVHSAGVSCVLAPTAAPLVRALRTEPGWRVVGKDGVRTLLVKGGAS
jgi:hypothetical protein